MGAAAPNTTSKLETSGVGPTAADIPRGWGQSKWTRQGSATTTGRYRGVEPE